MILCGASSWAFWRIRREERLAAVGSKAAAETCLAAAAETCLAADAETCLASAEEHRAEASPDRSERSLIQPQMHKRSQCGWLALRMNGWLALWIGHVGVIAKRNEARLGGLSERAKTAGKSPGGRL